MPFSPIQDSILECKGEKEGYYYWDNLESVLIYFVKENKSLSTFVPLLLRGVRRRTFYSLGSGYENSFYWENCLCWENALVAPLAIDECCKGQNRHLRPRIQKRRSNYMAWDRERNLCDFKREGVEEKKVRAGSEVGELVKLGDWSPQIFNQVTNSGNAWCEWIWGSKLAEALNFASRWTKHRKHLQMQNAKPEEASRT